MTLRGRPAAAVSLAVLAVLVLAVLLAPVLAPYSPLEQDLRTVLSGPTAQHLLGTDTLGRDVLSRLLYGGRSSLLGVVQAMAVYLAVGVPVGLLAGFFGGATDWLTQRVVEILLAVPPIILILVVLAVFPENTAAAMVALGVLASPALIRVLRGATLTVRGRLFVRAARTAGLTEPHIVLHHVLPALAGPLIVQTALTASGVVLVETGLGFLGFGAPPPAPSWGNMVAEASQTIDRQPWLLVPSGVLIGIVIIAFGLIGDGLRDASASRWGAAPTTRRTHRITPTATNPATPDVLLAVRGLTVDFPGAAGDGTVLHDVDLDVRPGELLGIVGESGSGKTVTGLALLGLLRGGGTVRAGHAWFGDTDLFTCSPAQLRRVRGSGIALISQEPIGALDPAFTVGAQLVETVRLHRRCSRSAARGRAADLLHMVALDADVASSRPHQLSGGMAQRVAIALALAGEPRLLIADEPTTALDVSVQAEILQLLADLRRDTGMAIILITHDWGVLAQTCDRALVMYAGEIVEQAPVAALFDTPLHPYTRGLLDANPTIGVPGRRLPAIEGTVPAPGTWPVGCHFQDRCPLVRPDCRAQPVPLLQPDPARDTRCLHHADVAPSGALRQLEGRP